MTILGKLFGVGVGPGAPDLLTLRAIKCLREVSVIACPRSNDWGSSKAWEIVREHLGRDVTVEGQERIFLTFPMKLDAQLHESAYDSAATKIAARLEQGVDVAFATEGDPSLFSSFIYLRDKVVERLPDVEIEVIPAVSSVLAVPSVTGIPLADGHERIAIVPGTSGLDDLEDMIDRFDTIVLMKIGKEMPRVVDVLKRRGLLDRAVYVSRATMPEQRVVEDLEEIRNERGDCFAMVVIAKKERNGVLAGAVPPLFAQTRSQEHG